MRKAKPVEEEILEIENEKRVVWTTEKEIFYLSYECGFMRDPPRMSRLKHLLAYRDAMKLREDWGTLKPVIIAEHVNMLIDKIQKGEKNVKGNSSARI